MTLDTQKLSIGWAVMTVEGLISKETAKLQRALVKRGAHKLAPKTYSLAGVAGEKGMAKLVAEIRALDTKETSVRALYVTRAQWERSYMVHGTPAQEIESGVQS